MQAAFHQLCNYNICSSGRADFAVHQLLLSLPWPQLPSDRQLNRYEVIQSGVYFSLPRTFLCACHSDQINPESNYQYIQHMPRKLPQGKTSNYFHFLKHPSNRFPLTSESYRRLTFNLLEVIYYHAFPFYGKQLTLALTRLWSVKYSAPFTHITKILYITEPHKNIGNQGPLF